MSYSRQITNLNSIDVSEIYCATNIFHFKPVSEKLKFKRLENKLSLEKYLKNLFLTLTTPEGLSATDFFSEYTFESRIYNKSIFLFGSNRRIDVIRKND